MHLCLAQTQRRRFANRADSEVIQLARLAPKLREAFEEIINAVDAGEDNPVVAVELLDGFVKRRIAVGRGNLYRRAGDDARPVPPKLCGKLCGLRPRTRDDNSAVNKRLSCPLVRF